MAFTCSRVKPRYLMPPSQGGCIIWQPEREWGGTGDPWERDGRAQWKGDEQGGVKGGWGTASPWVRGLCWWWTMGGWGLGE